VVKLSADLAEAVSDGAGLSREAYAVAERLGMNANVRGRWPAMASSVIHGHLNATGAVRGFLYQGGAENVAKLEEYVRDVTVLEG